MQYSELIPLGSWDIFESVDAVEDEDEGSDPLGTIGLILPSLRLTLTAPSLLWNYNVLFLQSWRVATTLSQGLPRRAEKEELCCGKSITAKEITNLTSANQTGTSQANPTGVTRD